MRAEFFERFGLFARRAVLAPAECAALGEEMAAAGARAATVAEGEAAGEVDERQRSSKWAQVSATTRARVEERLLALKPDVERHFGERLRGCQQPQFLVYREGDFFGAHEDTSEDEDAADFVRERRFSVVLFVNGQDEGGAEGSFGGGALTFYGLMGDRSIGLPVDAEPGLVVAFPAHVLHGVTPVTRGERRTVVTWFH